MNSSLFVWLAAINLGLALAALLGGPRLALLPVKQVAGPTPERAAQTRLRLWSIAPSQWRFGLLSGLVCWLLLGQSMTGALIAVAVVPGAMGLLAWLAAEPERRRHKRLVTQLPECLDLLSAALTAGIPLRTAVRHVASVVPEPSAALLGTILGHLQIGRSDAQAWATLHDHPSWGPVARDLSRCADSGAGVAEVLGVHAAEARAQRQAQREMQARSVSVRSILPLVSCFLPAFILVGVVPIIAATINSFVQGIR